MRIYATFFRQKGIRNILILLLAFSMFLFVDSMPSTNLEYYHDENDFKKYSDLVKMKYLNKGTEDSLNPQYDKTFQLEELYDIAQTGMQADILESEIFKIYEDSLYRLEQAIRLEEDIIEANIYMQNVEKVITMFRYVDFSWKPSYFIGDSNKLSIRYYDMVIRILEYYNKGDFLSGAIYLWGEFYVWTPMIASFFGFMLIGMLLLIIHLEDKFYKQHASLLNMMPRRVSPIVRAIINSMTVLILIFISYLLSYVYLCVRLEGGAYMGEFWKGLKMIWMMITSPKMMQVVSIYCLFCYSIILIRELFNKSFIRNLILISILCTYLCTYGLVFIYESARLINKYNILIYLDFDKYITGFREETLFDLEQFKFFSPNQVIMFLIGVSLVCNVLKWGRTKLRKGVLI